MDRIKRVFNNTGLLYVKMMITMIISLFTVRIVLNSLGAADYGTFNLVAGIIAMLSFLNSAMSNATQRYFSYYIGASDIGKLKSLFNSSILIHLIIGLVIVLILKLCGLFLFDGILNIPIERVYAAKTIFTFMIISTFFTVNSVPFDATIIAHENFLFDAISGTIESLLKLGIAGWVYYTKVDNLILYGLLIAVLTIIVCLIKAIYCFLKYEECTSPSFKKVNLSLMKELFAFAGWNLYGSFCYMISTQGLAVLLNMFFTVIVNAAYGIANQVNAQLSSFSSNMMRALIPQIVKSEGSGDRERMLRLSMVGSKVSFFLLAFFSIPFIVEMPFILNIWLKTVPDATVMFCRLILILSLIQQISSGLMIAISSVGKIKVYQIIMGSLLILNLPLAYFLIKSGFPPYSVLISSIFIECIALYFRMRLNKKITGLNVNDFLINILFKSIISVILASLFALIPHFFLEEGILRGILSLAISVVSLSIFGMLIAFTSSEKKIIKELFISMFSKALNLINNNRNV